MIPRIYQPDTPAGERAGENFAPSREALFKMKKFNEELEKAGMLVDLDGLHPISKGSRVKFANGKPAVTDGPFIESKEVVGGYWFIQAPSKEEVVKWASRCPAEDGDVIEIRQIFEMSDFPPDIQKAVNEAKN
jgi:hypothetical protein